MVWQGLHLQVVHTHCICLESTIHQLEIVIHFYLHVRVSEQKSSNCITEALNTEVPVGIY